MILILVSRDRFYHLGKPSYNMPGELSKEEPTELEIQQVQEPTEIRKKGYEEPPILTIGWIILWLIKNAIVLLIILLLLEYVIGPILDHIIFSGCWETLPGADCS